MPAWGYGWQWGGMESILGIAKACLAPGDPKAHSWNIFSEFEKLKGWEEDMHDDGWYTRKVVWTLQLPICWHVWFWNHHQEIMTNRSVTTIETYLACWLLPAKQQDQCNKEYVPLGKGEYFSYFDWLINFIN